MQVKAAEILGQLGRREASAQLAPLLGADGVAPLLQTAAAGEALDLLGDVQGPAGAEKTMASKGDQQAKLRATLYLCGTGDADARNC